MGDTHKSENLALSYHSNGQNQNRFGQRSNNFNRKNNSNYQRPYRNEFHTMNVKPLREVLSNSGDIQTIDSGIIPISLSKKDNSEVDIDNKQSPVSSDSRNSEEIINLALPKDLPLTDSQISKKCLTWDKETTDPINALEALMSNDSKNWQKPFPLENKTNVAIVHFDESPAINCWVMQNQYTTKGKYLQDVIKRLHSDVVESPNIITNEIYSVQYKDVCYRGVCLYKVNSKEVLVRLIDVGLTFQSAINSIKCLDPRLKTINAFAFEINFDTKQDFSIGQKLCIYSFSVDATGTMNVKLNPETESFRLEILPLQTGVPLELFCLDYSNIEKGFVSACIHDPKKIESINGLCGKITDYLKNSGATENYVPKLDEICFAYHDFEHQWYRAECIKVISPNSFQILFIDYGNTRIVNSSNIRKLVSDFTEPAIMHFCYIQGKRNVFLCVSKF